MASLMWFVTLGLTLAVTVNTVVRPSHSISRRGGVAGLTSPGRALLRKNWEFVFRLTFLMLTGVFVPGSRATFLLLRKKAKTSLKLLTNSLYSSDPNTKLNFRTVPLGTKSNSRTVASLVFAGAIIASRSVSPGVPKPLLVPVDLFGPTTESARPVLRIMPASKPMLGMPPVNLADEVLVPLYVTLLNVTPVPTRVWTRFVGVRPVVRSVGMMAGTSRLSKFSR